MNFPMDGMSDNITQAQKEEILKSIERAQIRDSMRLYNNLVERCFNACIETFRSKNLDATETSCVQKCCEKYLGHSARIGMRFQELSAELEKQQMEQLNQMRK